MRYCSARKVKKTRTRSDPYPENMLSSLRFIIVVPACLWGVFICIQLPFPLLSPVNIWGRFCMRGYKTESFMSSDVYVTGGGPGGRGGGGGGACGIEVSAWVASFLRFLWGLAGHTCFGFGFTCTGALHLFVNCISPPALFLLVL